VALIRELFLKNNYCFIVNFIVYYKSKQLCLIYFGVFMLKFLLTLSLLSGAVFAKPVEITLTERNSVVFNQAFSGDYVAKKQLEIISKNNLIPRNDPLYIVMDTPGGSVTAGLAFIDTVRSLKRPVHTITLFAASMGYQVVQELGTRFITPSGTLMSHRGAVSGMSGQVPGELNSRLNYIMSLLDDMNRKAAQRVKMDLRDYKDAIINELWIYGHHAVATKHADAIADVKCDKKLSEGTNVQEFVTIFGNFKVTYSNCPLISGPISFQFSREFKQESKLKVIRDIQANSRKVNLTL
jgi:ATP-dependent protease ClpP protease subunit